jgi:hypothetical protein
MDKPSKRPARAAGVSRERTREFEHQGSPRRAATSKRALRTRPTAASVDPIHQQISAEGAELRRRAAARLGPADPRDFPAVWHLYRTAVDHVRKCKRLPESVRYRGKLYAVEVTNFGRVKVLDSAGRLLMSGGLGAAW